MTAVTKADRAAKHEIRRLTPADMERVMEIEVACFAHDAYDEKTFLQWFRQGPDLFLLAEQRGTAVAYIIASLEGSLGHIVSLAVDPASKRLGIGTSLVAEILCRFRNGAAVSVHLESRFDNLAAIHFWRQQGFVPVGSKPGYYEDGASALAMSLRL